MNDNNFSNLHQCVRDAKALGFNIFSVPRGSKKPDFSWKNLQTEMAPASMEKNILTRETNYAIVTGEISNVIVVDCDDAQAITWAEKNLPPTPLKTKSPRGEHWFYKANGIEVRNKARIVTPDGKLALDIRGNGGYVIGPGSQNDEGKLYLQKSAWAGLKVDDLPDFPASLLEKSTNAKGGKSELKARILAEVKSHPVAIEGDGGDTTTYILACKLIWNFSLSEEEAFPYMKVFNERCKPAWNDDELKLKIRNAKQYGKPEQSKKNPKPPSFKVLATEFCDSPGRLLYWQGEWMQYKYACHQRVKKSDVKALVTSYLQRHPDIEDVRAELTSNVMLNLEANTFVDGSVEPPFDLRGVVTSRHVANVENGILDLSPLHRGGAPMLLEHSKKFFCLSKWPIVYDPDAKCTFFLEKLKQILPDNELRNLLQEWFGYHLFPDNRLCKFIIYEGEGANGKSVICTVQSVLIGSQNCSALSLEAFDEKRTFPLAGTVGKIANIAEEMSEIDKAAEGLLKQYVSGGLITAERKNKDPFEFRPSAKLTFATNVLPRFRDTSNGLARRLMLIPFRTIFPDHQQDKRLVDPLWWKESGELPGIFNWALEGYVRLVENGSFSRSAISQNVISDYLSDLNPAASFLRDYFEFHRGSEYFSTDLYSYYKSTIERLGFKAKSHSTFSKEVQRVFPKAMLSENALRMKAGGRSRVWRGLRQKKGGTSGTEK